MAGVSSGRPMTPERWQRARQVLNEALEREPHERARFLAEACSGDESLRQEVEALVMARNDSTSAAKRSVKLVCFFQPAVAFVPIHVLHECIDIHSGI